MSIEVPDELDTAETRRDLLLERLEDAENAACLYGEAFAAALELWRESRERLVFVEQLLADVLRER
jgi:hypothetical protein